MKISFRSVLRAYLLTSLLIAYAQPVLALDDARLLDILVKTYPDFILGHKDGYLLWKDGTRTAFDDGRSGKDFATLLDRPSIKDMFYARYKSGRPTEPPELNIDPGRVRYEPFFLKMYGDCRTGETSKTLVDVVWLPKKWGKTVKVTRVNGVAEQLAKISAELDRLPASFDKYLFPHAGTLNCRTIAGTSRMSAHGTATAIDVSTKHSHYWQWQKADASGRFVWHNEIPIEIVEIFEKHGFIWGGKWYHYDTMHFEYRPDLIEAGKAP